MNEKRWQLVAVGAVLVLLWPLLLRGRGAPFEGFHRRELLLIALGIAVWTAALWALGAGAVLFR